MAHTMMDSDRIRRWTQGLCDPTRVEETIDAMVALRLRGVMNASAANRRRREECDEIPRNPAGRGRPFPGGARNPVPRPARQFTVEAPQAWKSGAVDAAAADVDWWAYFGDRGLRLGDRRGVDEEFRSPRGCAARIAAARQETRIAAARRTARTEPRRQPLPPAPELRRIALPGASPGKVLSATNTNTGFVVESDLGSRYLENASRPASSLRPANLESREADLAGARLSLTAQVAKAWFAAIEAERQVGLAKASLVSYENIRRNACGRVTRAGIRPSLDLRLALSEIDRAQALVQQREQQRDAFVRQLETLAGRYPAGEHVLAEDLPEAPRRIPAGLPSERGPPPARPDLRRARSLLAADARIVEAKAALRPSFSLTSGLGTASNKLVDLLNPNVQVWNYVTNVVMPIFNNGRLKAGVRGRTRRARWKPRRITKAASSRPTARLKRLWPPKRSWPHASRLSSRRPATLWPPATWPSNVTARGLSDIITVLSAQRTALDSESALLTVRRASLDNRVDLHLALGGGFAAAPPAAAGAAFLPHNGLSCKFYAAF